MQTTNWTERRMARAQHSYWIGQRNLAANTLEDDGWKLSTKERQQWEAKLNLAEAAIAAHAEQMI